ncbi:hypothetical protein [Streptomyces sp. JB150]|uniref:hypothetical protein n=1 Tax=Streptomyces sp. JB150 TaxID=2714844 RepID=UPI0014078443|nr:hypothetical protein [Streptomyces sp. JB150]QIJ62290.1 hypothetical protein G7Z13_09715 [Streptomyces sp. JB150]
MSTTRQELVRRLRRLLALALATTCVLFVAYRGVHDDTVPLASSSTPGILAVDTARHAMRQAHEEIRDSGPEGDISGEFHTWTSVAHQSLALAASENVTGAKGRHDLQTITGLIAVYSAWVERWGQETDTGSPLRAAYLHYAERVLGLDSAPGTDGDVMSRLDALRAEQLAEAERQAAFTWQQALWWSAVAALYVALCLALLEAQRFLRRRFRKPVQLRLLAATGVCALGVPVLAWLTIEAHGAMADTLGWIRVRRQDPDLVPEVADNVERSLADAGLWSSLSDWVLWGGAVVMALTLWGLRPRIAEYRFRGTR